MVLSTVVDALEKEMFAYICQQESQFYTVFLHDNLLK